LGAFHAAFRRATWQAHHLALRFLFAQRKEQRAAGYGLQQAAEKQAAEKLNRSGFCNKGTALAGP
jgi:hypothetical protein